MADYQAAFKKGLEAFKASEKGRLEVTDVLREFRKQIYFATDRQTVLYEAQVEDSLDTLLLAGTAVQKQPGLECTVLRYQQAADGYPVIIRWGERSEACGDKSSLEATLERVLEDPTVAGILFNAANRREGGSGVPGVTIRFGSPGE